MASILHGSARTTPRVRAELQASKERPCQALWAEPDNGQHVGRSRSTTADAKIDPRHLIPGPNT